MLTNPYASKSLLKCSLPANFHTPSCSLCASLSSQSHGFFIITGIAQHITPSKWHRLWAHAGGPWLSSKCWSILTLWNTKACLSGLVCTLYQKQPELLLCKPNSSTRKKILHWYSFNKDHMANHFKGRHKRYNKKQRMFACWVWICFSSIKFFFIVILLIYTGILNILCFLLIMRFHLKNSTVLLGLPLHLFLVKQIGQ